MDSSMITPLNMNKICRICIVETEGMHSIFSEIQNEETVDEEITYVYEILMNISAFRILEEDKMSTMICTNCLELANSAYRFQLQCNRSQAILEAYVAQINMNKMESAKDLNDIDALVDKDIPVTDTLIFDHIKDDYILNETIEDSVGDLSQGCHEKIDGNDVQDEAAPKDLMIKVEIKEEPMMDAAEVAALEDNMKLKQKLALKRMQSAVAGGGDAKSVIKRMPRTKYSYYVKTNDVGEKVYACNLCDKCYKFGSSLKVHMRSHTLERPYVCTLCGKDFKQYCSLSYHLRSHSGEQPYKCKICGKRYKQSGSLTAHMRIHTGQRPFLCSICGRGFRQAPDLGYHMRTHTKEKPYMCNICGKTMSMQCHLVQHMRTHTGERPFKCTECSKAFPSSTRLKRHAIIHTGLKPYSCDVCDKSFNRRSSLRMHAKIHTDERPHVCKICGKGFIQAHSLKSHITTHYTTATFAEAS